MYLNHLDLTANRLTADSEEAEQINGMMAGNWFDKEALNALLAEVEPDQVICFVKILCGEVHAGFRVIHRGQQTAFQIKRCPDMDHIEALGEAMQMADEYEKGQ